MVVEGNGTILFEDSDGLYQLDPTATTPVATSLGGGPGSLAIGPDGQIYRGVSGTASPFAPPTPGGIYRVDPQAGAQTLVWQGAAGTAHGVSGGMAVESNGTILFNDSDGLYQLDPTAAPPVATRLVPGAHFTLAVAPIKYQWTGQGPDNLWSDGANWLDGSAPTAGADLVFPSGAQSLDTVDDLGYAFHSITVADHYSISGQPLTVTGNLLVRSSSSLEVDNTLTVAAGGTLDDQGTVTVAVGGTLDDQGAVTVEGPGQLAVAGTLTVEQNATLTNQGVVTLAAGATLDDQGVVTLAAGSTLNDQGAITVEAVGSLTIATTVRVGPNVTLDDLGTVTVATGGTLDIDGSMTVAAGGNLVVQGSVTVLGNGTLDDQGTVTVAAGGSLDDRGSTTVEAGASVDVLGTLTVEAQATLDVSGTVLLEASSTYNADPLASVIVEPGGYLGPPM
jgi:hypothetical protein